MTLDGESRRRAIARARVSAIAIVYAKKEYSWKHVDARIIGQLNDESFHVRVKGSDLDGNQDGDAVELEVNESGTISES